MNEVPIDMSPTEGTVGNFERQFDAIRALVCSELQAKGAEYAMSVQKLVRTCISANLEINSLAEKHCQNILARFKACRAKLVSHTTCNAMFAIDDKMLMVNFDLAHAKHSIMSARFMQPSVFDSQLAVTSDLLLLKQLQCLLAEPVDDANIAIPYCQCMNSVASARKQLNENREVLRATILSRACTAFNFEPGLSLYTLNYSDDMSMQFWDRYTITESTMKSYYIEQHCIVEHTITGDIEEERFIQLHKPSKNNVALFLADRLACLTSMTRPTPTMAAIATDAEPVQDNEPDDNEPDTEQDDLFTDDELRNLGLTEADIKQYHIDHGITDNND